MEFSWIGNKYNCLNKLINVEVHDYIWGFRFLGLYFCLALQNHFFGYNLH